MTNSEAKETYKALTEILSSDMEVSVKTGFALRQNAAALEPKVKLYDEEHDRIILKDFPDGKVDGKNDKAQKCIEDLVELGGIEIDAELYQISIDDLAELKVPAKSINAIMPIIKD